jgi:hypothetical protein
VKNVQETTNMSKKAKPATRSRREFLKGVAVMGGTATLAVVTKAHAADAPPQTPGAKLEATESKGYHVTPHIADYYGKARF